MHDLPEGFLNIWLVNDLSAKSKNLNIILGKPDEKLMSRFVLKKYPHECPEMKPKRAGFKKFINYIIIKLNIIWTQKLYFYTSIGIIFKPYLKKTIS